MTSDVVIIQGYKRKEFNGLLGRILSRTENNKIKVKMLSVLKIEGNVVLIYPFPSEVVCVIKRVPIKGCLVERVPIETMEIERVPIKIKRGK